jgi:hypothetical protein
MEIFLMKQKTSEVRDFRAFCVWFNEVNREILMKRNVNFFFPNNLKLIEKVSKSIDGESTKRFARQKTNPQTLQNKNREIIDENQKLRQKELLGHHYQHDKKKKRETIIVTA